MDMRMVLDVGLLLVIVVAAVRWRRNPLTRPANAAALWFSAGYFVMRLENLLGVRVGAPPYLLEVGGLACILMGAYKLAEYKLSRSKGESQER